MAKRKTIIIVALLVSLVAGSLPVVATLFGLMHYVEEKQINRLDGYADEILRRTIETASQLRNVFDSLALKNCPPCSQGSINKMLEYQMTSNLLQSVAAIQGNYILCTSNGVDQNQDLGEPDGITPSGTRSWLNVQLDFAPNKKFNIYEANGYAGIVPTDQVLDLYTHHKGLSLAVVLKDPGFIVRSYGSFRQEWLDSFIDTGEHRFKTNTHWVVVKVKNNIVVFAAIPIAQLQITDITYIVAPLGLLLGVFLSLLVLYFARLRLSVSGDIKAALKRHEFFMMYQPVVDLKTGEIKGAESLIRWKDTDGNFIPPDVFIPIAEQNGLIEGITKEVIHLVDKDAEALWRNFPDFHIAINLSSFDLHNLKSVDLINTLLDNHKTSGASVIIEATERGFVELEQAKVVMNALHDLGVEVAIDDFGTGYSSLSHLESLDLDYLKIDKAFIDTLGTEAATSSVALHIIEMAKSLDLKMIAEGIETKEQADLLREKGVEFAQGWYFGRPMFAADLLTLLKYAG